MGKKMKRCLCLCCLVVLFQAQDSFAATTPKLVLPRSDFRLPAGQTVTISLAAESQQFASQAQKLSTFTVPTGEHEISVGRDRETNDLFLAVPLTMPPGAYAVTVSLEGGGGQRQEATIQVAVDPLPPIPQTGRPPVLLLNGFQFSPCQASKSEDIFGELPSYLKADGVFPLFFDNCVECRKCEIEKLGDRLGQYLTALRYTDGTTVPEVDIVAHSMGGLIVRSYLTGKQSSPGVFNPPTTTKVRKAIFTGTPHFGARIAGLTIGSQARAMSPGSRFLWELSQWNQGVDDLRGTDALAIIGAGGFSGDAQGASDGVVALTSASLSFAFGYPDERTRIVPYCHIELSILRCHNRTPLAKVDSETHLTSAIVRSFLSDTDAWKRLGWSPSQDPYLSHQAGMYFAFQDSSGTVFTDITRVRYTTDRGTFLMDESTDGIWHTEWVHSFTKAAAVVKRTR